MTRNYDLVSYREELATGRLVNRRVRLEVIGESAVFLRGYEVDRDAEEVHGPTFERRLRLIDKTLITRRTPLRLSLKYGWLVPAPRTR